MSYTSISMFHSDDILLISHYTKESAEKNQGAGELNILLFRQGACHKQEGFLISSAYFLHPVLNLLFRFNKAAYVLTAPTSPSHSIIHDGPNPVNTQTNSSHKFVLKLTYVEILSGMNSKSCTIKTITIFVVYFSFVRSCLTASINILCRSKP